MNIQSQKSITIKFPAIPLPHNENPKIIQAYEAYREVFRTTSSQHKIEIWELRLADQCYLLSVRDNGEVIHFEEPFEKMEGHSSTRHTAFEYLKSKYGEGFNSYTEKISICSFRYNREKGRKSLVRGNKDISYFLNKFSNGTELRENTNDHSWSIISKSLAIKKLDRSAFLHRGTGVPIDIRSFFNIGDMVKGEQRDIILEHNNEPFSVHFEMDRQPTPRTRLFWRSDFSNLLRERFIDFYKSLQQEVPLNGLVPPKLKFECVEDKPNVYKVTFVRSVDIETIKNDIEGEHIDEEQARKEGKLSYYYGKRYERDPINRQKAIEIHGTKCIVCKFDFEEVYGERGMGYIQVHHKKPLSTLEGMEEEFNPVSDLVPICPNCHVIVHRKRDEVLSIEELKEIVERNRLAKDVTPNETIQSK